MGFLNFLLVFRMGMGFLSLLLGGSSALARLSCLASCSWIALVISSLIVWACISSCRACSSRMLLIASCCSRIWASRSEIVLDLVVILKKKNRPLVSRLALGSE